MGRNDRGWLEMSPIPRGPDDTLMTDVVPDAFMHRVWWLCCEWGWAWLQMG